MPATAWNAEIARNSYLLEEKRGEESRSATARKQDAAANTATAWRVEVDAGRTVRASTVRTNDLCDF
jgi:hypothetical protein